MKPRPGYMNSTFLARELPEAIWIGEECIAGPFCVHCGNPLTLHGPKLRCPNRVLHPLLPPPSCTCHGLPPTDEDVRVRLGIAPWDFRQRRPPEAEIEAAREAIIAERRAARA